MFGSSSNSSKKQKVAKIDTLVGGNSEINGDITFGGGLHIDGTIKGNVYCKADQESLLILSENGRIEGEVRVKNITINGTVVGDIYAEHLVELAENARVTGTIYYGLIEMAVGAEVNGQLVQKSEQSPQAAKPISITSASKAVAKPEEVTDLSEMLSKH